MNSYLDLLLADDNCLEDSCDKEKGADSDNDEGTDPDKVDIVESTDVDLGMEHQCLPLLLILLPLILRVLHLHDAYGHDLELQMAVVLLPYFSQVWDASLQLDDLGKDFLNIDGQGF